MARATARQMSSRTIVHLVVWAFALMAAEAPGGPQASAMATLMS